jgi:hypothetical protein
MSRTGLDVAVSFVMEDKEPLSKEGLQPFFLLRRLLWRAETGSETRSQPRKHSADAVGRERRNGRKSVGFKGFFKRGRAQQLAKDILADENAPERSFQKI